MSRYDLGGVVKKMYELSPAIREIEAVLGKKVQVLGSYQIKVLQDRDDRIAEAILAKHRIEYHKT